MTRFDCYPPAETKIPLSGFLKALWPQSCNFGEALCSYLGVESCMLANSGRTLLYTLLALTKSRRPKRNEVLIPGYTCYSVAASAARADLTIKAYDLDPKSLFPDVESVKQLVSDRTLAIVIQHIFGIPTEFNEIHRIAKDAGAILIEDAAQALGGSINGSLLGTEGDFGLYSFGRGKPLPLGSGGALIGKNEDISQVNQHHRRPFGIVRYAIGVATQVFSKPSIYSIAEKLPLGLGATVFEPKFEVSAMESLVDNLGKWSLKYLADLNSHRKRTAHIYSTMIKEKFRIPPLPLKSEPVYTRFPLMMKSGPISVELRKFGVRRMYPKAIVDEETIAPYLAEGWAATPGAKQIALNLITLPTHRNVTADLAHQIADLVNRS